MAEAEAALEVRKKPPVDSGPRDVGEGLVIDEWVTILPTLHLIHTCTYNGLNFLHDVLVYNLLVCSVFQKERREKYLARQQVGAVDSV